MEEPQTNSENRFPRPADYYSSPTPDRVVPRWALFGCGGAAALVMVLVFAGGAFLSSGGFVDFMDMALGMSVGEMKGMYSSRVSAGQKKSLEQEIEALRAGLREKRVTVAALQPFLEEMRKATSDNTVTPDEVERLRKAAQSAARR